MMTRHTATVIGAGPAGCAAAITLGRHGISSLLLERGQPGKDKPCGDAYLPDAIRLLDELGIPDPFIRDHAARSFEDIDLWDSSRRIWSLGLDGRKGWIAPRARIDQALRNAAAEVSDLQYGTTVTDIHRIPAGWRLEMKDASGSRITVDTAAVVIATGAANSLSRRHDVSGSPLTGASISAYAHVEGVTAPVFQFSPMGIPGYGWIFPLAADRVNIGVCSTVHAPSSLRETTLAYIERWQPTEPEMLRAGAGPMWSGKGKRWHEEGGLVSCGDAAGLVDPLTGEGIAPALESGIHAAMAISAYLDASVPDVLATYSNWMTHTFSHRYADTPVRRLWRYLNGANGLAAPDGSPVHTTAR